MYDDKFSTEIFGHNGVDKYMNHNLDMKGKFISLASQLPSLTYVYTPTIRATNIEFWDVANIGATDLIIQSGITNFIASHTFNVINVYKLLLMSNNSLSGIISITASGDIEAGSITTISSHISSTSGNIQTRNGIVDGKMEHFRN